MTVEICTPLGYYTCEPTRLDALNVNDQIVTDSPLGARVYLVIGDASSNPNGWLETYEITSSGDNPKGFFSFPGHTLMNRVVR